MMAVLAVGGALTLAGCGSSGSASKDPTQQVPAAGGLREKVAAAARPEVADFPAVDGRSLQQVADSVGAAGPQAALAGSVFTEGVDRLAFGVIGQDGKAIYGKTAVYLAPTPEDRAQGPYLAPADVLLTQARYRSKQAATEQDPFAAIYAARVRLPSPGKWSVLVVTHQGGKRIAAATQIDVTTKADDAIPDVGEPAPAAKTDTLASAKGDIASIDTRVPPDDMHAESLDRLLGRKPVALLFATPQLCQSRVCGPVTDIAAQMKAEYGDRVAFIHQEVYVDNQPDRGLREPLRRFKLRTEPWLFVIGRDGRITARLEGSFGVKAFERALQTAL
jgi:hypothetical protein